MSGTVSLIVIFLGNLFYSVFFEKKLLAKLKPYLKNVYTYTDTEIEKKIAVLKQAKWIHFQRYYSRHGDGLCNIIKRALVDCSEDARFRNSTFMDRWILRDFLHLINFFEYFTSENANKYAKGKFHSGYWWNNDPYNYRDRQKFLDWMIEQYKKDMSHGQGTD